jgi:chorismate synthase
MSKAIVAIESHGHQVSFKVLGLPSQVQLATNMVHLLLQKEQQG